MSQMCDYDLTKINVLLSNLDPRKVSIISRLSGLTGTEIAIMRLKWLEDKTDIQICEMLNMSQATLTRKRKHGHIKILSALDLYGLSDFDSIQVTDVFDYEGLFYKAQDLLIKYCLHHPDESSQRSLVRILEALNEQ